MANAVTSTTGVVASGVATFKIRGAQKSVFVYVNYNKGDGASVTMKLAAVNPGVHASNAYEDTAFATATMAPKTATFDTTGKYRFEIPICRGESVFTVIFAFTGGATQAVVCDLYVN